MNTLSKRLLRSVNVRWCTALLAAVSLSMIGSQLNAQEYVGHNACTTCHGPIYDDYIDSGHPYKLNKVENGEAPVYPFSTVPDTPEGYSWDDITYVIGGYGWKARFIDDQGYIITGDAVQYNLLPEGWVGYHADEEPGTKPYNCGACHTTGWSLFEDNGGNRQDDLPGMAGTFAAPGVECEACHGPGGLHVQTLSKDDIIKDTSAEACGSCHFRNGDHSIAASGGFIRHHEQFDEMINSPHSFMDCVQCHDPHKSAKYELGGVKNPDNCTQCHPPSRIEIKLPEMVDTHCTECHMPMASKSATTTGSLGLLGDLSTHTFRLNTDIDAVMFSEDGKLVELDGDGNAIVRADFACIACHDGVVASLQTVEEMYSTARLVHDVWGNAVDDASGWRWSSWLGWIWTESEPWVYSDVRGWLYIDSLATELNMNMWQDNRSAWLFTDRDMYPWVYDYTTGVWTFEE